MTQKNDFRVGDTISMRGYVTRLIDIINRDPAYLEDAIGFHRGRLASGYHLLLLKEPLSGKDLQFCGYTYFSGGKFGRPETDSAKEAARQTVQSSLEQQLGEAGVSSLAQKIAADIPPTGQNRLVKIMPLIGHDREMNPAAQYPASELGIAQFNLIFPKKFLVSAFIGPDRRFQGGGLDLVVDNGTGYDDRHKVYRYLSAA